MSSYKNSLAKGAKPGRSLAEPQAAGDTRPQSAPKFMNKTNLFTFFKYIAIAGNIIFVLWILVNGIDEGFQGTIVQIFSYIGLILLLALNTILLFWKRKE
jgi:LPXTG-motif cell wall-anchored protein